MKGRPSRFWIVTYFLSLLRSLIISSLFPTHTHPVLVYREELSFRVFCLLACTRARACVSLVGLGFCLFVWGKWMFRVRVPSFVPPSQPSTFYKAKLPLSHHIHMRWSQKQRQDESSRMPLTQGFMGFFRIQCCFFFKVLPRSSSSIVKKLFYWLETYFYTCKTCVCGEFLTLE